MYTNMYSFCASSASGHLPLLLWASRCRDFFKVSEPSSSGLDSFFSMCLHAFHALVRDGNNLWTQIGWRRSETLLRSCNPLPSACTRFSHHMWTRGNIPWTEPVSIQRSDFSRLLCFCIVGFCSGIFLGIVGVSFNSTGAWRRGWSQLVEACLDSWQRSLDSLGFQAKLVPL